MPRMKTKTRSQSMTNKDRLDAIFIHFQPMKSDGYSSLTPEFQGMMRGLMQTLPGRSRNKQNDAYNAERDWHSNLSFVAGLYTLIPQDNSVLKAEAEKLLLKMFGKGFSADRLARFNAGERKRIKKNGDAAWRLVRKLRKHYGLSDWALP
jgi:hypothetical protein